MGFICTPGNKMQPENKSTGTKLSLNVSYSGEDDNYTLSEDEAETLTDIVEQGAMEIYQDVIDVFPEIDGLIITIRKIS